MEDHQIHSENMKTVTFHELLYYWTFTKRPLCETKRGLFPPSSLLGVWGGGSKYEVKRKAFLSLLCLELPCLQ